MAEILPTPLRLRLGASRPSSFSCFHTLFVHSQTLFSEPSRYGNANAITSFDLRSSKRRNRFRILSKSVSDSDFGLISAAERSDGSIVFRFGNAKDYETMVASVDVNKADDAATEGLQNADCEELNERMETTSEHVISHSERLQRSYLTQVSGEVKTVIDGDSRVVDSVSNDMSELTVSLLEETVIDTEPNDLLCSNSSVDEDSVDGNKDVIATKDTSLEVEKFLNEAIGSDVDEEAASICDNGVIADSMSSKLDSGMDLSDNSAAQASSRERADPEVASFTTAGTDNGNFSSESNTSTETPAEVSLDEETSPSKFDGYVEDDETENPMQLGHNASSTNGEEVGVSKSDTSNVEELPIPGVVEFHSIEDTPDREGISTGGFVLSSGAALVRSPSKGLTHREDAYFVAENWLGVADGVGQWSLEGTSDGVYVRELMENCERIISHCKGTPVNDPGEVLFRSVAETKSPGSSTILVAHFDGRAFHVANIGDSGFMIIRNGAVIQQSSPVVHEFNFPFHVESGDDPSEHIEAYKIELDDGDVIITATDGLFDNLYDHDIVAIVSESLEAGGETQEIAESLASKALELGQSSSSKSPFADAAQAAGYAGYSGGKLDDVVVTVSLVQKRPSS